MARLFLLATLLLLCTASLSCDSLNIPPAPDLQPVLNAYENPSAVVDGEIMGEVADEIADAAEEIEDSEIFEEILDVIIEVQQELEMNTAKTCNGGAMNGSACATDADCPDGTCVGTTLVLNGTCNGGANNGSACEAGAPADCPDGTCDGVSFPSPNGGVQVNFICDGWDERQFDPDYETDPANGTILLNMTLDDGGIGRVVWGTADNCLYLVPGEGDNCEAARCFEASYHGGVAVDLGDPVPLDEDITELLVTFVVNGTIGFDGDGFDIDQSFRVKLADTDGLAILVDIGEQPLEETFTYFFQGADQGLSAANGEFVCNLEDMECRDQSGTFFSW